MSIYKDALSVTSKPDRGKKEYKYTSKSRYITGSVGGIGCNPRFGHQCSPISFNDAEGGMSSTSEIPCNSSTENLAY
jgi:hypothetical protein